MTRPPNPPPHPLPTDFPADVRRPSTRLRAGRVVAIVALAALLGVWAAAILLTPVALALLPWLLLSSAGPE